MLSNPPTNLSAPDQFVPQEIAGPASWRLAWWISEGIKQLSALRQSEAEHAEPNNQLKENSKVVVEKVMLAHTWDELGQVSSADVVCVSVITIFETL